MITFETHKRIREHHIPDIVSISQAAFGAGMGKQEVLDHLVSDVICLVRENSLVKGFALAQRADNMLYLSGAAVHPDFQSQGVYTRLTKKRIGIAVREGITRISTRTQNPIVECGIRHALDDLIDYNVLSFVQTQREVIPKVYGRMLTGERPHCVNEEINSHYDKLDYDAGDAFALIFSLGYAR